jgi:hypothetical protein
MTYRMRQSIPWRTLRSVFAQGEPRRQPKQCPDRDDEGRPRAPFRISAPGRNRFALIDLAAQQNEPHRATHRRLGAGRILMVRAFDHQIQVLPITIGHRSTPKLEEDAARRSSKKMWYLPRGSSIETEWSQFLSRAV